jgi:hypothetical protein
MFGQLLVGEHVMLVRKDLFMPGAQIAHLFVVNGADMAVQIGPAEAGKVAFGIGAVVAEEEHGVAYDILASIPDANIIVGARDFGVGVFLEALGAVVGEDDKR